MGKELFLVLPLFIASFFLSGLIYSAYPFPLIADSWDHVAIANQMASTNSLSAKEPYYASSAENPRLNPESGFHAIALAIIFLTGLNALSVSILLPSIATFILSLSVFMLSRYITQSNIAGILSALSALLIPSTISFMGFQYFAPMAMGLALMPLLILLFFKAMASRKFTLLFFFAFFASTTIYPAYPILLLPFFALHFLLSFKNFYGKKIFFAAACATAIVLILLYGTFIMSGGIEGKNILEAFIFKAYSFSDTKLNIFSQVSPLSFILAIPGFLGIVSLRKNFAEKFSMIFLAFFLLLIFLIFKLTGTAFIVPAAREFSAFSLLIAVFSGWGIYFIYSRFFRGKKTAMAFIAACIVLFGTGLCINSFDANNTIGKTNYIAGEHGIKLLDKMEIPALNRLKSLPKDSIILSSPDKGRIINVFTGLKVSPVPAARLGTPDSKLIEGIRASLESGNCSQIKEYAAKFKASFIYQNSFFSQKSYEFKEISCPNISKIYSQKNGDSEIGIYSIARTE